MKLVHEKFKLASYTT
jgi:Co/Zn/Cd efflux system component